MFIPLKDDQPTARKPYLTVVLITINTLVFLYSWFLGPAGFESFTYTFGFTPDFFLNLDRQFTVPQWIYLTPLTSMFMHGGWMHLIGNMLFLWIYGNNIEDYFGPTKFLLFYIISGLAAVALFTIFNPESQIPLVGASGAIAGVMGAYMVLHPRAQITVLLFFFVIQFLTIPAKTVLGIWIIYQLAMSFLGASGGGGVAWLAHVGGFAFGYLLLRLLLAIRGKHVPPSDRQRVYRMQW